MDRQTEGEGDRGRGKETMEEREIKGREEHSEGDPRGGGAEAGGGDWLSFA